MIPLSNPSMNLQAVLGGAVVATQPIVQVGYYDMPSLETSDAEKQIPGWYPTALNNTTDVVICPAIGTTRYQQGARVITSVSIYNGDTASVNVEVFTDDGTTERILIKATLGTLESLYYEDGDGWYSTDANGARKTAISQIPQAPLFLAYNSVDDTNQTGAGTTVTVEFDTEVYDVTGNYSASTDTFTAPITGKYLLSMGVLVSAIPAGCTSGTAQILTSNRAYNNQETFVAGTWTNKAFTLSVCADMDAADTATVRCVFSGGAGDTATIEGSSTLVTFFSGVRVG